MKTAIFIFILACFAVTLKAQQIPAPVIDSTNSSIYEWPHEFWEAGLIFGSPIFLNPLVGYHINRFGLQLSGMYYSQDEYGLQIALPYCFYRGEHSSHSLALEFVRSFVDTATSRTIGKDSYAGFGVSYQLNWRGFFLGLGVLTSEAAYTLFFRSMEFQIGYVYQFR